MLGAQAKQTEADEFTMTNFKCSALHLILINLLNEYEKKEKKMPALLDTKLIRVGLSFQAHKKCTNILQILYVKQKSNAIS